MSISGERARSEIGVADSLARRLPPPPPPPPRRSEVPRARL